MYLFISKKLNNSMKFVTGLDTVKPVEVTTKSDFVTFGKNLKKKH
jgi:hypothetical protein